MQWLMWQMGVFGPTPGQTHFFLRFNKGLSPTAEARFADEARRRYGVLDRHLADRDHIGADCLIADMATILRVARTECHEIDLTAFLIIRRWYRAIAAIPAARRGYQIPAGVGPIPMPG